MEVQAFISHYLPILTVIIYFFISFIYGVCSHIIWCYLFLVVPENMLWFVVRFRVLLYFSNFLYTASAWIIQIHMKVFYSLKGLQEVGQSHMDIEIYIWKPCFTQIVICLLHEELWTGIIRKRIFFSLFLKNVTIYVISDIFVKYS